MAALTRSSPVGELLKALVGLFSVIGSWGISGLVLVDSNCESRRSPG